MPLGSHGESKVNAGVISSLTIKLSVFHDACTSKCILHLPTLYPWFVLLVTLCGMHQMTKNQDPVE